MVLVQAHLGISGSAERRVADDPDPPPTDAATTLFAPSPLIRNNDAICRLSHVGMKLILNPRTAELVVDDLRKDPGEGCRSQRSAAPCLIPGGAAYYCSYASPKDDISMIACDRKKPKKCVRAKGSLYLGSANQIPLYLLWVSGEVNRFGDICVHSLASGSRSP